VPPLIDEEIGDAAAATAATLETARKGIIYEHQPASLPAQRLATELKQTFRTLALEMGGSANLEHDGAAALRCIERRAPSAANALPGDASPVYVGVLGRMMSRAAEEPAGQDANRGSPVAAGGSLIIPR
jgi:hypothetical protein